MSLSFYDASCSLNDPINVQSRLQSHGYGIPRTRSSIRDGLVDVVGVHIVLEVVMSCAVPRRAHALLIRSLFDRDKVPSVRHAKVDEEVNVFVVLLVQILDISPDVSILCSDIGTFCGRGVDDVDIHIFRIDGSLAP